MHIPQQPTKRRSFSHLRWRTHCFVRDYKTPRCFPNEPRPSAGSITVRWPPRQKAHFPAERPANERYFHCQHQRTTTFPRGFVTPSSCVAPAFLWPPSLFLRYLCPSGVPSASVESQILFSSLNQILNIKLNFEASQPHNSATKGSSSGISPPKSCYSTRAQWPGLRGGSSTLRGCSAESHHFVYTTGPPSSTS